MPDSKKDDDDDDDCAAQCRKIRAALLTYAGSFFAVTLAFVAYNTAANSKPMKDPDDWVKHFEVDVWFRPSAHLYYMLNTLAAAAMLRFVIELVSIILNYGRVYKILMVVSVANLALTTVVILPIIITGFVLVGSLWQMQAPDKIKCSPIFADFESYRVLIKEVNDNSNNDFTLNVTETLAESLSRLQERIDWVQSKYLCCGLDKHTDWNTHMRPDATKLNDTVAVAALKYNLQWWNVCAKKTVVWNETCSVMNRTLEYRPKSCCPYDNPGACRNENVAKEAVKGCKMAIKEVLTRCLGFSCGLLLAASIFGAVGAVVYWRTSVKGIVVQKRYLDWLTATGQTGNVEADD